MLKSIKSFFDNLAPVSEQSDTEKQHAIQLAVSVLLVEMSRMDGKVSEEEMSHINELLNQFNLSQEDKRELSDLANDKLDESTDYYQFTAVINKQFDQTRKIEIIEQLWQVAYADGKLNAHEEHFLRKIHSLIHVSHQDFMRTKQRVINNK